MSRVCADGHSNAYRTQRAGYVQWFAIVKAVLTRAAAAAGEVGWRGGRHGAVALGAALPFDGQMTVSRRKWCKRVHVHRKVKALRGAGAF